MHFIFEPINEELADIVETWDFEGEYSCYDVNKNERSVENILNSDDFDTFLVKDEVEEPVGFLACTFDDNGIVEMENFLSPGMIGQGIGVDFISECIDFILDHYDYNQTILDLVVKASNEHSVKVYERAGFSVVDKCGEWIEMQIEL